MRHFLFMGIFVFWSGGCGEATDLGNIGDADGAQPTKAGVVVEADAGVVETDAKDLGGDVSDGKTPSSDTFPDVEDTPVQQDTTENEDADDGELVNRRDTAIGDGGDIREGEDGAETRDVEVADGTDGVRVDSGNENAQLVLLPSAGELIFHEVLVRGGVDGPEDPNGDGIQDSREDEFVELVNISTKALELKGVSLSDRLLPGTPRHTFKHSTVVLAGEAIVLFGGGYPLRSVPGSQQRTVIHSSKGRDLGLHLRDRGNSLTLRGVDGQILDSFEYGEGTELAVPSNASLVRGLTVDSPWISHRDASSESLPYSPGRTVEGLWFEPK